MSSVGGRVLQDAVVVLGQGGDFAAELAAKSRAKGATVIESDADPRAGGTLRASVVISGGTRSDQRESSADRWRESIERDLTAVWLSAQRHLAWVCATGGSLVVCRCPPTVSADWRQDAVDAAVREGLHGLVKGLATELGATGVRVNMVSFQSWSDITRAAELAIWLMTSGAKRMTGMALEPSAADRTRVAENA